MKIFWYFLYNLLVIPVFWIGGHIAGLFNRKAHAGLAGRRRILPDVEQFMSGRNRSQKCILFHCASMGEYEQIRPVLREISQREPDIVRIVSFFSSSGYDNVVDNPDVDLKTYLPLDTPGKVRHFLNCLRPDAVVISKHDVWPNLVWALASRQIPSLLVNGTMPIDSVRAKPVLRNFFRSSFVDLSFVAPASEQDMKGFRKILPACPNMEVLGDTRYDQVLIRAGESKDMTTILENLPPDKKTFVAGSTWPSDEEHLLPAIIRLLHKMPEFFAIIIPHELNEAHIEDLIDSFESSAIGATLYSKLESGGNLLDYRVLIINRIGILANLYGYGQVAYVGGSFGPGVHNVMEPAAYGIPVLFGPRILNSPEARALQECGAGFLVEDSQDVYRQLERLFADEPARQEAGRSAKAFIDENSGATERITGKILSYV
ncbi:MAG: glycosyltransferase N-terminal domain-containing protein [bacterium]